jgi:hypothetical protein
MPRPTCSGQPLPGERRFISALGNRVLSTVKYRVPHGRVPAPPWVGSRSPDGWDQIPYRPGGWVLHQPPWSLGSIPKREEPGKTGAPCVKVPGSSRVPLPSRTQLYHRSCSNKHTHPRRASVDDRWFLFVNGRWPNPSAQDKRGAVAISESPSIVRPIVY